MKLKEPELRRARIEIIPMIDTIFFLLVFFMITWLSLVKMSGLTLQLPRENLTPQKAPPSIVVSVSQAGQYYIDGRPMPASQWPAGFHALLAKHPNAVVVVNVDPSQKTQTLVTLIDTVNRDINQSHLGNSVVVATRRIRIGGAR